MPSVSGPATASATAPASNGIHVTGLAKRYGHLHALDDVHLDVHPGSIVALLGQNGAGKSTMLRILGTTVLPDAGTANVAGIDVVAHPRDVRSRLGLVLGDERAWYWRLTGRHNLEFFAALHGMDRASAAARTQEVLDRFGMTDAADRPFRGYSAGMRSRLSLARAVLTSPPVLLLDEPTSALDPVAAVDFRDAVRADATANDTAVLFATHDLHEAAAIADHVIVLHGGRVVERLDGPTTAAQLESVLLEVIR